MNPPFKLSPDDIKLHHENTLDLFYSGIKSPKSKGPMDRNLKKFLIEICADLLKGDYKQRAQQFVEIAREDQQRAAGIVSTYVRHLCERTELDKSDQYYLNPSTVPNKIKPIKKLLEMNDLSLPWKRIRMAFPPLKNKNEGRGYTREEIKILLEHSDSIATDFIILASSSGGLRVGAWEGQTWGSVFPIYELNNEYVIEIDENKENAKVVCAAIIVYKGEPEEYIAVISIEAWKKLLEYKKLWTKRMNRNPVESDPLILERFSKPTPLTVAGIQSRILNLLFDSGLRTPLTEGKKRQQVPATHGFRRYWNKVMMNIQHKRGTLSALVIKERLLGHQYEITKTDKNYYFTSIVDLAPFYLEGMPELMVSDEERLKQKLENEKNKSAKLQTTSEQLKDTLSKMGELEAKMKRMEKYQKK